MGSHLNRALIGLFASLIALSLAGASQSRGRITTMNVPAPSLAGNLLGDPADQTVAVYLPDGYEHSSRRYPVLYLLHGFSLHPVLKDWEEVIAASMDQFVAANPDKAFIVVIPNGANRVHGSYYMDSTVGGGWESYIAHDLVAYTDSHFRTIDDRRSRAIAGHSMGGFGALRMLLLHPDIYSVGYAISPCCLDFTADMTNTNAAWKRVLKIRSVAGIEKAAAADDFWSSALAAFAIAASPDPLAPIDADLPYQFSNGRLVEIPAVVKRWKAAMPLNLVDAHVNDLKRAAGIAIDYGYQDEFSHIPLTSRAFGEKLLQLQIPAVVEGYNGDHNNGVPARIQTRVIPFIAGHLRFSR
jgi:S-formylglutathione hydrolase FrmB